MIEGEGVIMTYCFIPARSGSKGLKHKNVKLLNGKPLLVYTIEAALKSGLFSPDKVIVSTDSDEYARIANEAGARVTMRSAELSTDKTSTYDLLENLLSNYEDIDNFVLLQPTSPFRDFADIKSAWEIFTNSDGPLISVCQLDVPTKLLTKLDNQGHIQDIIGLDNNYFRQEDKSQPLFYPNGAIYISNKNLYLSSKSFYLENTKTYVMNQLNSVDIDTIEDFEYAEYLLKKVY